MQKGELLAAEGGEEGNEFEAEEKPKPKKKQKVRIAVTAYVSVHYLLYTVA